ncbi:MAG TPA: AAA family ATPase [Firmicutes bacterium]|nr:AAA family ATPase [Bacillota bacterium]HHT43594.1 AAA family ATPase [Bacillota bacterium]
MKKSPKNRNKLGFGANASGKSNLVKAVDFARKIIVDGSADDLGRLDQYCKFNKDGVDQPGVFQFEMAIDGKVYSYGFALSYRNGEILEEWLYLLRSSGAELCLFARDETGHVVTDMNLRGVSETRFEVYKDDIKALRRELFLAELARKPQHEDFSVFKRVYEWFNNIIVIFPQSKYMPLPLVMRDEEMKGQFQRYLTHFDTGVDSIEICPTTLEMEMGSEGARQFLEKLRTRLTDDAEYVARGPGVLLILRREKNELKVEKLRLKHADAHEPFDLAEESSGTKRLFDLIPLLLDNQEQRVIFIDELDRSMHPRLTAEFVKLFYMYAKEQRLQMIVTTHEQRLLDLDLVRQDEIWFVERLRDGSKLFSLDDFRVRYDKHIEKHYLLGRFGAVPLFASHHVSEASENYDDSQA